MYAKEWKIQLRLFVDRVKWIANTILILIDSVETLEPWPTRGDKLEDVSEAVGKVQEIIEDGSSASGT
jgi:hypothetical protein